MTERDDYRFPLHGDYGTRHADTLRLSAAMIAKSTLVAEARAQALEQAIRANIGRAHHVARIDGDHVTDLVRDADGETLAAVVQEWEGYVVSISVYQHAEPSFIRA